MRNFCFNGFAINCFAFIFVRWPLLSVFFILLFNHRNAGAQFQLHCDAMSAVVNFSSSANARLLEIAGQPHPLEPVANANFILHPGFIPCLFLGLPTSVDEVDKGTEIPQAFALLQNYPNPFNPVNSIQFAVASEQFVSLKVYDMLGNEVVTLVNERKAPGVYCARFEAGALASGVYFIRMRAGDFSTRSGQKFAATRKILLAR